MGGLLVGLLVLGIVVAFAPARWRAAAVLSVAVIAFGALLFAVGASVVRLMPAGDTPARVSIGSGAWVTLASVAVAWYQGAREAPRRRTTWIAAAAACAFAVLAGVSGGLANLSLAIEYRNQDAFWSLVGGHVAQSVAGMGIGALLGVPLGIAAARSRAVRSAAIPVVSIVQTVPSLALFGLLMVPLAALDLPSIGTLPALIALTLYALLPIVRNTYVGLAGVDPAVVDAGLGMGMSRTRCCCASSCRLRCRSSSKACARPSVLTHRHHGGHGVRRRAQPRHAGLPRLGAAGRRPDPARCAADGRARGGSPTVDARSRIRAPVAGHPGEAAHMIRARGRHQALRRHAGRRRPVLRGPRGRGLRAHRPVGLRQDHDAAHDQPPHRADQRPDLSRRSRRHVASAPEELRRSIGYVIQSVGLFPHLTVAENIATVPQAARLGSARGSLARVAELLELVGLDAGASMPASIRASSPVARRSASAWRARLPPIRRCCSWTSRSAQSTRSTASDCRTSS